MTVKFLKLLIFHYSLFTIHYNLVSIPDFSDAVQDDSVAFIQSPTDDKIIACIIQDFNIGCMNGIVSVDRKYNFFILYIIGRFLWYDDGIGIDAGNAKGSCTARM